MFLLPSPSPSKLSRQHSLVRIGNNSEWKTGGVEGNGGDRIFLRAVHPGRENKTKDVATGGDRSTSFDARAKRAK